MNDLVDRILNDYQLVPPLTPNGLPIQGGKLQDISEA
jgi:hypothetical protein